MCPFSVNSPELCKAALTSLMIDEKYCCCKAYETCPLFLINKSRMGNAFSEVTLQQGEISLVSNITPSL